MVSKHRWSLNTGRIIWNVLLLIKIGLLTQDVGGLLIQVQFIWNVLECLFKRMVF